MIHSIVSATVSNRWNSDSLTRASTALASARTRGAIESGSPCATWTTMLVEGDLAVDTGWYRPEGRRRVTELAIPISLATPTISIQGFGGTTSPILWRL